MLPSLSTSIYHELMSVGDTWMSSNIIWQKHVVIKKSLMIYTKKKFYGNFFYSVDNNGVN